MLAADLSAGARRLLREIIETRIPDLLAPTLVPAPTYAAARAAVAREIIGDDPAVATDALGQQLAREALAAMMLVKLKKAKVVAGDVTLTTALSPKQLTAMETVPGIAGDEITIWGGRLTVTSHST